jgi:hypothetical protein
VAEFAEVPAVSAQPPEFGELSTSSSQANGSFNGNGAGVLGAVGVAEESTDAASPVDGEVTDQQTQDSISTEAVDDSSVPEAAAVADPGDASAEPESTEDPVAAVPESQTADDVVAAAADDGSTFRAQLVRAMRASADAERARIVDETQGRRDAHIAAIHARQASEAARMRELFDEDMKAIDAWAEGEQQRIQSERERRAAALQEDLDTSLAEHTANIGQEVDGVEAAVTAYRADIDRFFEGLASETDPVAIARQATRWPAFPNLEASGAGAETAATGGAEAEAAAETQPSIGDDTDSGAGTTGPSDANGPAAVGADPAGIASDGDPSDTDDPSSGNGTVASAEPAAIGVMDPDAPAEPAESWTQPVATDESSPDGDRPNADTDTPEPVAATATPIADGSGSLFHSVQVLRPMGWLRREMSEAIHPKSDI